MIHPHHWQEWKDSAVADGIIALNVRSLIGDAVYDYLCYSDKLDRTNNGRLTASILRKYQCLADDGGWWCGGGTAPLTWEEMLWGQFKGEIPRKVKKKEARGFGLPPEEKVVKYEPPPKTETRAYFLHVPDEIWEQISNRYSVPITDEDRQHPGGFWSWVWRWNVLIIITEGAKKAAALLTAGYPAIALPGITGAFRSQRDESGKVVRRFLIPELEKFATPGREVYYCFDQDCKPQTRKSVRTQIVRGGALWARLGCIVKVIYWLTDQKGVDDFIVANGAEAFHSRYESALGLDTYAASELWELTYRPDLKLNQRYLENIPYPKAGLAAIKSPKNTGKTQALVTRILEATRQGQKALVITHRVQLGMAICEALGIDWVDFRKSSDTQGVFGYGICIDSVHPESHAKFNPEDWEGAIVILDEVEQLMWHLLNSSTCYENRVKIIETLGKLLGVAACTGGLIIAQDADLSDLSLDFIRALVKRASGIDLQPWVCVNYYDVSKENCWKVFVFDSHNSSPLLSKMREMIEDNQPFIVHTDGQKPKSTWGTINLESRCLEIAKELGRKPKILRIDSTTVGNPGHPAFGCIDKLNKIAHQYDIIIASPSIGTGVSIDIKGHFKAVFGIFQGVGCDSDARQNLARLREPIPRYIWARGYGVGGIGNRSTSYQSLIKSKDKVTQLNIKLLRDFDFDLEAAKDPVSIRTWAKMAARVNASIWRFREALIQELILEGHQVKVVDGELNVRDKEEYDKLKGCQKSNREKQAYDIEAVEMPSDLKYQELKNKRNKTTTETSKCHKYFLHKRYGVEVTADLVLKDADGWYEEIIFHYLLTHNPEYIKHRTRKHLEGHKMRGNGKVHLPDLRGRLAAVEFLRKIDPFQWLEREIHKLDPELNAWADSLRPYLDDIRDLGLGSIPADATGVQFVQTILRNLGVVKKRKSYQKRFPGVQNPVWVHCYCFPDDGREVVFEVWQRRDAEALEKAQAMAQAMPSVVAPFQAKQLGGCHTADNNKDLPSLTDVTQRAAIGGFDDRVALEHCMAFLAELEAGGKSFDSVDELIEQFQEVEFWEQRCFGELPGDFWQRISIAIAEVAESIESRLEAVASLPVQSNLPCN
jgi:hypothetical protein